MHVLEVGSQAPDFKLPKNGGGTVSLSELSGQKVVVYFYPKDNTPGCTNEAKDFTARFGDFEAANTAIVGISKDSVKKHDNFVAKHDLKVTLGSDEDGKMCEDYGVWVEKNMYGRKYMGIERSTFLIDENGIIQKIWRKVKVKGHVAEVLEAAQC